MPLPEFNEQGDLPVGVHLATLDEVCARLGGGTPQRQAATHKLRRVYDLARRTGKLQHFVLFGSYVTSKPAPNDIDVILIMCNDFQEEGWDAETQKLFKHGAAAAELGASIFWARPNMLLRYTVEEFLAGWQVKRDHSRRGIVEVQP